MPFSSSRWSLFHHPRPFYPAQDLRLNSRCFMNDLRVVKFMQFWQVCSGLKFVRLLPVAVDVRVFIVVIQ